MPRNYEDSERQKHFTRRGLLLAGGQGLLLSAIAARMDAKTAEFFATRWGGQIRGVKRSWTAPLQ